MSDDYVDNIFSEDENLFFEYVIQQDFDLLLIDALLRQTSFLSPDNIG